MATTYLQAVNDVLIRLRESTVSTVSETSYSTLIGKFVNDTKRAVEDAYTWNVLTTNITIPTVSGTATYSMTGAGQKFRVMDAVNVTGNFGLRNIDNNRMYRYLNFGSPANAIPSYYAFNGVDGNYDTQVDVFPKPDGVYNLVFTVVIPQDTLSSDSTVISVPAELVIQGAYARALVERGEDGGLNSSEAYALYRSMLSDYIALESTRYPDEGQFEAV